MLFVAAMVVPGVNGERIFGFGGRFPALSEFRTVPAVCCPLPGLTNRGMAIQTVSTGIKSAEFSSRCTPTTRWKSCLITELTKPKFQTREVHTILAPSQYHVTDPRANKQGHSYFNSLGGPAGQNWKTVSGRTPRASSNSRRDQGAGKTIRCSGRPQTEERPTCSPDNDSRPPPTSLLYGQCIQAHESPLCRD